MVDGEHGLPRVSRPPEVHVRRHMFRRGRARPGRRVRRGGGEHRPVRAASRGRGSGVAAALVRGDRRGAHAGGDRVDGVRRHDGPDTQSAARPHRSARSSPATTATIPWPDYERALRLGRLLEQCPNEERIDLDGSGVRDALAAVNEAFATVRGTVDKIDVGERGDDPGQRKQRVLRLVDSTRRRPRLRGSGDHHRRRRVGRPAQPGDAARAARGARRRG